MALLCTIPVSALQTRMSEPHIPVMTGLRVLLLDNDSDAQRLATDMLAAEGYTVYACSTPEHAARMTMLLRPHVYLFHGSEGEEGAAFRTLLAAGRYIPLVYFSREQGNYEVYAPQRRKEEYARISWGHKTISGAVRAALLQTLEAV